MNTPGFRLVSHSREEVPVCERGEFREGHLAFVGEDGFEAMIPRGVVGELHALARRAAPLEFLGGVYGALFRDAAGTYAVVRGIVAVEGATATDIAVASTPATALATDETAERLYPGARRLGWCHSHPTYGTHFSPVDTENQATYRSATALGIVVDPWCREDHGLGVYRGPHAQRLVLNSSAVPKIECPAERGPVPMARRRSAMHARRAEAAVATRARLQTRGMVMALAIAGALALCLDAKLVAHEGRLHDLERTCLEVCERPPIVITLPGPPSPSGETPSAFIGADAVPRRAPAAPPDAIHVVEGEPTEAPHANPVTR